MEIDRIKTDTLPDDGGIVRLFEARDEEALRQTEKAHGALIRRVASRFLDDGRDCEEVVSDVLLAAWNAIPPHRPDPLRTFVCRIARNLATKKYHADTAEKRNSRYDLALDELEDCLADRSGVEEALEAKELAEAINGFMATLSYADRFLFTRRYWYADPVQDVAAMAHATPNSVTVRLFRIRQKLKRYLEKEGLLV